MFGVLAGLVGQQTVGAGRALAARLRRPWVLIPAALGALFALYALAVVLAALSWASPVALTGVAGSLALWSVGGAWMAAAARPHPGFTPAEVQILAISPLSRRQLLGYRLLRAQPGFLLAAIAFGAAAGDARLPHPTAFAGAWMVLNAMLLHQVGAALALAKLGAWGARGWKRTLPAALVVTALACVVLLSAPPSPGLDASASELLGWSDAMWHVSPAREVLRPIRILVELPLAPSAAAFAARLPAAAGILAALGLWVWWVDADFIESAAGVLDDRADRDDDDGKGWLPKAWPVPALSPTGPAWTALTWRGLVGFARRVEPSAVITVVAVQAAVALAWSISRRMQDNPDVAQSIAGLALAVVVLGPSLVTADLRQDLDRLDVIRAWPVRGRDVLRGAVVPGVLATSALHAALIGAAAYTSTTDVATRLSTAAGAMVALPGATALAFALANGMAVWAPSLERRDAGARGIESVGRLIASTAIRNLALWILLLPAWFGLALGVFAANGLGLPGLAETAAGAGFGIVAVIEAELFIRLAGRSLDRLG